MFDKVAVLYIYTETPLHAGSGSRLATIDLPIQRERITDYPLIQGSSLKGVWRSAARQKAGNGRIAAVFGPERIAEPTDAYAGALTLTDARLLLFPVRSLVAGFAWVTSALALERLRRDLALAGQMPYWQVPTPPARAALVTPSSQLLVDGRLVLEDFDFPVEKSDALGQIAKWLAENALPQSEEYLFWRSKLPTALALLPDEEFGHFLRHATEVTARIRLKAPKNVEEGPWYEEALPAESLLYSLLLAGKPRGGDADGLDSGTAVIGFLQGLGLERLQMGGDETTGRGIVSVRIAVSGQEASHGAG
ncbi:MAG TPA: type III-B CRISPR module RAMP protein Cmr4 [Alphaproteobacteria bacterium]|nr:type III-B CRISPR module RAMP protein Cmr4 [Alphaproteobacteria bacterium]